MMARSKKGSDFCLGISLAIPLRWVCILRYKVNLLLGGFVGLSRS